MEIARVEILKHIRYVQLSAKQRARFYEWDGESIKTKGKKVPINFFNETPINRDTVLIEQLKDEYFIGIFNGNKLIATTRKTEDLPKKDLLNNYKYRLCLIIENSILPLVSNPKIVDTPRMYLIKGQDFYNSKIREFQRGFVMDKIKECYTPFVENMPVITQYPIKIVCEIHDTIKSISDKARQGLGLPWDIDNYAYPYMKAFPDLLQKLGKIKNDDRLHITQPPSPIFCPIENHEDRKLVFIISKDERDIITNNEIYKSVHKNENTYETEDLDLVKEDEPFNNPFKLTIKDTFFNISDEMDKNIVNDLKDKHETI